MRTLALTFHSDDEFFDFQLHVQSRDYKINKKMLTLTGGFAEKEIQLAISVFDATVLQVWDTVSCPVEN